jgi:hexosaminidase
MRAAQYLLWPRTLAISESVWSPQNKKDWNGFIKRVEGQFERMDVARIKYARSMYDPSFTPSIDNMGRLQLKMETEVPDLHIYYSFDETNPDEFYPEYKEQVIVPPDALHVKVITYRNNKPIGKQINMPVEELKKRIKKG